MRELATPAMHVAPDPPAAAGIAARIRDSDVAPCSVTRTTSADIEDQAASLKQWKQVYDQLTPGPFVGSIHEICCGGIQVFRETTNQAMHESGAPWRGSRAIGVPVKMAGAALFRGQPVDPDTMVTLGGDDELDFYTPRGFDILGLVVDESALESHARQVEHRDIAVDFGSRGAIKLRVRADVGASPETLVGIPVTGRQPDGASVPAGATRARTFDVERGHGGGHR